VAIFSDGTDSRLFRRRRDRTAARSFQRPFFLSYRSTKNSALCPGIQVVDPPSLPLFPQIFTRVDR